MIYVFEGMEGVGKSTIAEAFALESRLPLFVAPDRHMPRAAGRSSRDWRILGTQINLDVAEFATMTDFVVDRWCLSSMVYDFLRGESEPDEVFQDIASSVDATIYVFDTDPEVALARILIRDGNPRQIEIDHLEAVRDRYLEVSTQWNGWGGFAAVVDATDLDALADRLVLAARKIRR